MFQRPWWVHGSNPFWHTEWASTHCACLFGSITSTVTARAHFLHRQAAIRAGFNYNLPYAYKLASVHIEYGHSAIAGPDAIVADRRRANEVRIVFRVSLQQYVRH